MSKKNPFADLDALRAQGDTDAQEFQRYAQEMPKPPQPTPKNREAFVKVPLWWFEQAIRATKCPMSARLWDSGASRGLKNNGKITLGAGGAIHR